ncbi:MAG: SIMPL domain-containing protein [Pseudomonadota bacterium]
MKRIIAILSALTLIGCKPFEEAPLVVVNGEGTVFATPDAFSLSVNIYKLATDQDTALRELSAIIDTINEQLPTLQGITALTIQSSDANLSPRYSLDCLADLDYGDEENCPIEGRTAGITLSITASPTSEAGNMMSLLNELGAGEVSLSRFTFTPEAFQKAQDEAADKALANARAKAERLAEAANASIGQPTRIQFGEGFDNDPYSIYKGESFTTVNASTYRQGETIVPSIELSLNVAPQKIEESVIVGFELKAHTE